MSTKKMRILLISMAVLLTASIGGYLAVDHAKKQTEQAEADKENALKLCSFDTDQVTAVDIKNPDGTFHVELVNGKWTLTETDYPHIFDVNSYYLNSIVMTMSKLTAKQQFDQNPGGNPYGLDANSTEITCTAAGERYTVYIGNPSVTKEYYYVSIPATQAVYGISYDTGAALCGGISYLHDPYLLHVSESAITGLKMEHDGEIAYDLYTDAAGQWQLNEPLTGVSINSVQVSTIITELVRLQYESFIGITEDKKELAVYGLDQPAYYLTVSTGEDHITFAFPDYDPNDSVIYVCNQEDGTIGTINERDSMYLTGRWSMLVDSALLRIPFADAKELEVTVDGKQFTLQIDHENSRYQLDDIDLSALDAATNSNFEYLYASVSEISMESITENPDLPEHPVPACRFRYTLNDGSQRTLELVSIDDVTYWAYVDGRCIGQTVRRNSLSGASGVLTFLEKITDNLADQDITYLPADAVLSGEELPETAEDTLPAESAAEEISDARKDESL